MTTDHTQLTPEQATAETAALMARAQQQIDAQVAQAELYCRQREEEATRRYDEIVHEARRQAKVDAERVAHQYRNASGSQYSSDQEQVQRQQVYLTALLHALDALATHVHATRHAFTVEFQKLGGQLDRGPTNEPATTGDRSQSPQQSPRS
jgi:vacuolar-type H+-ATPase subunit H